ncbi:MAG: HDOD domain-containing protein [bacterium]|nr:HDOD domain-containing protein [bacterium]
MTDKDPRKPVEPAEKLEQRVVEVANLPTLPGILKKISKMTESADSSAADVADLIAKDQVLSAKVLRLVNSPFYGFPGRISSVTHAVVLLGFSVIKGLVLGTAVFDTIAAHGQGLWQHSLGTALFSRRLALQTDMSDPEEIMVAGLLHDLGKVILTVMMPEAYCDMMDAAVEKRCHVSVAERDALYVDHARVASWVANEWHFPARLAEPITYHHRPDLAKECKDVVAIVHVADILSRGMGYGWPGDDSMPTLDHEAFQSLRISFQDLDTILEEVDSEFSRGIDVLTLGE